MFFLWATTDFSVPSLCVLAWVDRAVRYAAVRCPSLDVTCGLQSSVCGWNWSTLLSTSRVMSTIVLLFPLLFAFLKCLVKIVQNMSIISCSLQRPEAFSSDTVIPEMNLLRKQSHGWAFQSALAAFTFLCWVWFEYSLQSIKSTGPKIQSWGNALTYLKDNPAPLSSYYSDVVLIKVTWPALSEALQLLPQSDMTWTCN